MLDTIKVTENIKTVFAGIVILVGLYITSHYNYLLFHTIAEMFSIIIACSIFILAWNSRTIVDNNYLIFIGVAYLSVAVMDFLHTIGYSGMGVFQKHEANLGTQLWIGARYLESISLMIAPLMIGRNVRPKHIFISFGLICSILIVSIFYWDIFPVCFIEGSGLTPFKKISEYIISLILGASIITMHRSRSKFDPDVYTLLIASIILTIAAETAFTFYVHAYGLSNLIGHYFKMISFYLIYRAIICTGLEKPYNLLFREIEAHRENLMELVEDRTYELQSAMRRLRKEVSERKLAQEEAIRAAQLASLGELAAGVAHEVNNPINGIINYAQIISNKSKPDSKEHEIAGRIIKESDRIAAIVRSLLLFAHDGKGKKSFADISDIFSETMSLLNSQLKNDGIGVTVNIPPDIPKVYVQPEQIEQVFLNIISNARYALNQKYSGPDKDKIIEVSCKTVNNYDGMYVQIIFCDRGTGIPEHIIQKMMNPFFSTKPNHQGTGIGLSISHGIINNHNGTIGVKSIEGQFTEIIIDLPVSAT